MWAAEHVREEQLIGGVRVWELLPQHKVAMKPIPPGRHARSIQQLAHCDTQWDTLAATAQALEAGEINSFRCVPTPEQAEVALAEFNGDAPTQRVLRQVFNVSKPCANIHTGSWLGEFVSSKSSSRQWLTALHSGMPKVLLITCSTKCITLVFESDDGPCIHYILASGDGFTSQPLSTSLQSQVGEGTHILCVYVKEASECMRVRVCASV